MKTKLFLAGLLISPALFAQATFLPPAASASAVEAVNFAGTEVGQRFRERFMECDARNTCDGKPLKYGCSSDRNRNSTFFRQDVPGSNLSAVRASQSRCQAPRHFLNIS